jgi:hypothetical protein
VPRRRGTLFVRRAFTLVFLREYLQF